MIKQLNPSIFYELQEHAKISSSKIIAGAYFGRRPFKLGLE